MSRAWFPRRLAAGIPALAAGLALAGAAFAQDPGSDPRSVTVIGGDANARRCAAELAANLTTDEAVSHCQRALRYPRLERETQIQLHIALGVMRLRRQESQEALSEFDAVVALAPRNAEARLNRGAALVQLRQYGPAITEITEALSLGVREPHKAYLNRGAAREALGDVRGAYEDYSTALEIQPDWGPANAELARFARARRERLAEVLNDASRH